MEHLFDCPFLAPRALPLDSRGSPESGFGTIKQAGKHSGEVDARLFGLFDHPTRRESRVVSET